MHQQIPQTSSASSYACMPIDDVIRAWRTRLGLEEGHVPLLDAALLDRMSGARKCRLR